MVSYPVEKKKIGELRDQFNAAIDSARAKVNGQLDDALRGISDAENVATTAPSDETGVDDENNRVGTIRTGHEGFARGRIADAARVLQAFRTDGTVSQIEAEFTALSTVSWPQPQPATAEPSAETAIA